MLGLQAVRKRCMQACHEQKDICLTVQQGPFTNDVQNEGYPKSDIHSKPIPKAEGLWREAAQRVNLNA